MRGLNEEALIIRMGEILLRKVIGADPYIVQTIILARCLPFLSIAHLKPVFVSRVVRVVNMVRRMRNVVLRLRKQWL